VTTSTWDNFDPWHKFMLKVFQNVPECSRIFQKILEDSGKFFLNQSEVSKTIREDSGSKFATKVRRLRRRLRRSRMFFSQPKCGIFNQSESLRRSSISMVFHFRGSVGIFSAIPVTCGPSETRK
jgi:predicted ATPase